jgi:DNA-binding GntR family transcriptional regulator
MNTAKTAPLSTALSGESRRKPQLAPITHFTLYERVYEELRSAIMDGTFASGETVTIRSVAKQLGTSEMPAREALRRLATEGALIILPNRSIRVPDLDADRVQEVCRLRAMLESDVVRVAAKRMTQAILVKLTAIHRRFAQSVKVSRVSDFLLLGHDFHFTIYDAAESPIAVSIIRTLWLQSGPWLAEPLKFRIDKTTVREFTESVARHHADLLDAMEAGDSEAAARTICAELQGHADHMRWLIQQRTADRAPKVAS